jgi:hypothetical protein
MENMRNVEKAAAGQEARRATPRPSCSHTDAVNAALRRYLAVEAYREDRADMTKVPDPERPES